MPRDLSCMLNVEIHGSWSVGGGGQTTFALQPTQSQDPWVYEVWHSRRARVRGGGGPRGRVTMWSEWRGKVGNKATFVGATAEATARLVAEGMGGCDDEVDSLVRRAYVVCRSRFGDSFSARPYWFAVRDLVRAYAAALGGDTTASSLQSSSGVERRRAFVEEALREVGAALARSGDDGEEGGGELAPSISEASASSSRQRTPAPVPFLFEGQLSAREGPAAPVWTERMDALAVLHDAIASSDGAADSELAQEVLHGLEDSPPGGLGEEFVRSLLNRIGDELAAGSAQRAPPPAAEDTLRDLQENRSRVLAADTPVQCSVCLSALAEGEKVTTLACGHEFHQPCVVAWLQRRCTCPNCRAELPSNDPSWEKHKQRLRAEEVARQERANAMTGGELQYT